jgi:hypothetical protein
VLAEDLPPPSFTNRDTRPGGRSLSGCHRDLGKAARGRVTAAHASFRAYY